MATAAEAQERAELKLEIIALMLGELDDVAREWEHLSDGERVAWSMDWSNEMSGLERLTEYAVSGVLAPAQEERYRALFLRYRKLQAVVARLGLYQPVRPLD
jgi:hypothetical protein